MTNSEFSNEFDVLYNNITSNQAPGIDEYEKSVFLTRAQDDIIKSYFNPKLNKVQEGFDGSQRRQIDFSVILKSVSYNPKDYTVTIKHTYPTEGYMKLHSFREVYNLVWGAGGRQIHSAEYTYYKEHYGDFLTMFYYEDKKNGDKVELAPYGNSVFDGRDNTKSVELNSDILMIINEWVEVKRLGSGTTRLTVIPISFEEYNLLSSKPFKRPVKNQAWRLMDSTVSNKAELIIGPNDTLYKYTMRYIRRPRPIILTPIQEDDLSIDGYIGSYTDSDGDVHLIKKGEDPDTSYEISGIECELDPILHHEILQRAVELASAAYKGDLTTQIALGQTSQTPIGIVTQSR